MDAATAHYPGHSPERAIIVQHGPGLPPEWARGLARLCAIPTPSDFRPARWRILVTDAQQFIERWGVQAARLGWNAYDVFGVNATKPVERVDAAGLVRLLDGRPVVALTAGEAVIQSPTGSRLTYRRKPPGVATAKCCLLWEPSGGDR